MTTQEVVNRLLELVKEGKNIQAEEELYASTVVSYEQNGQFASGLEAVINKTKESFGMFEEIYSAVVSQSFVGENSFLLIFDMDFKPKGGERMQLKEYGFYKVAEGKVVEEYFFAQPQ